jgi:hypothetical protein
MAQGNGQLQQGRFNPQFNQNARPYSSPIMPPQGLPRPTGQPMQRQQGYGMVTPQQQQMGMQQQQMPMAQQLFRPQMNMQQRGPYGK